MGRESAQRETAKIIAAITLPHHTISGGNAFVVEAQDEEEQEKIMLDIAKAIKADVMKTSNGIYLLLRD